MLNKYRLFSLSLLIVPATLFPMDAHLSGKGKEKEKESTIYKNLNPRLKEEWEQVYENAPEKIKKIVVYLKNPSCWAQGILGSIFLVGKPGVGKTTLAKAIAYKAGWRHEFFTCAYFQGKQRNETAINLRDKLNNIVDTKEKTVVIIDEINQLLENYQSEHHDTDMTSKALWTFLDVGDNDHENNYVFLIGTMNEADKIPEQIKDRMEGSCIELSMPTDSVMKIKIFRNQLANKSLILDDECSDAFLDKFLSPLQDWSGRTFARFSIELMFTIEDIEAPIKIVKQKHLIAALKEFEHIRKDVLKRGKQKETDEERRYRENVQLQEKHHKENLESQEFHMVQQILTQTALKMAPQRSAQGNFGISAGTVGFGVNGGIGYSQQINFASDCDAVKKLLSDEQMKIYNDRMAKTQAMQKALASLSSLSLSSGSSSLSPIARLVLFSASLFNRN